MQVQEGLRRRLVRAGLRQGLYTERIPSWMPTTDEWSYIDEISNRHWRPVELGYKTPHRGDDARIKYLLYFLDVRGLRVLELGPRTGHHTILLDKMGAREIVGVEGRPENLALCEQAKQRFRLPASFVCQDLERLAAGDEQPRFAGPFDLVFSLGLLYHLADPFPLLAWCRSMAPTLFLGTHYFEPAERYHYSTPHFFQDSYRGRDAIRFIEKGHGDPRGGLYPWSIWLHEDHLVELLHEAGYERVEALGKDVQSWHPHITLLASASS